MPPPFYVHHKISRRMKMPTRLKPSGHKRAGMGFNHRLQVIALALYATEMYRHSSSDPDFAPCGVHAARDLRSQSYPPVFSPASRPSPITRQRARRRISPRLWCWFETRDRMNCPSYATGPHAVAHPSFKQMPRSSPLVCLDTQPTRSRYHTPAVARMRSYLTQWLVGSCTYQGSCKLVLD